MLPLPLLCIKLFPSSLHNFYDLNSDNFVVQDLGTTSKNYRLLKNHPSVHHAKAESLIAAWQVPPMSTFKTREF